MLRPASVGLLVLAHSGLFEERKTKKVIKVHRERCQQHHCHSTTMFIQFSLPISNNKSHSMAKEKADSFSEASTQTERVTVVLGLC